MHELAAELWPIPRNITGPGSEKHSEIQARKIPDLKIESIPVVLDVSTGQFQTSGSLRDVHRR